MLKSMNNAIKIITDTRCGVVSYAKELMWINDNKNVAITCSNTEPFIQTRKNMNRILVYTTHFKSKIIPCNLSL